MFLNQNSNLNHRKVFFQDKFKVKTNNDQHFVSKFLIWKYSVNLKSQKFQRHASKVWEIGKTIYHQSYIKYGLKHRVCPFHKQRPKCCTK